MGECRTIYIACLAVRWETLSLGEPFGPLGNLRGPGECVAFMPVFDSLEALRRQYPDAVVQTAEVSAEWGREARRG